MGDPSGSALLVMVLAISAIPFVWGLMTGLEQGPIRICPGDRVEKKCLAQWCGPDQVCALYCPQCNVFIGDRRQ